MCIRDRLSYVEQYSADIMESVQNFAKVHLLPNINNIISGVSASLWTMVTMVKNLGIGLIVAVYLLNSRKKMCIRDRTKAPPAGTMFSHGRSFCWF